jgi:hypothetical protein
LGFKLLEPLFQWRKKRAHNVWISVVRFFLLGPRNGQLMAGYMCNTLHDGSLKKLNNRFRPLTKVSKKTIESNLILNLGKEPGERNCPKLLLLWENLRFFEKFQTLGARCSFNSEIEIRVFKMFKNPKPEVLALGYGILGF